MQSQYQQCVMKKGEKDINLKYFVNIANVTSFFRGMHFNL